jgi:hypothetical protein
MMRTPRTAMPRGKNTSTKTSIKKGKTREAEPVKEEVIDEESEDAVLGFAPKEKIPAVIEIEEREDVLTPIDKLVADPLLDAASIEGADTDDLLDEEEIDPFGDKWEA